MTRPLVRRLGAAAAGTLAVSLIGAGLFAPGAAAAEATQLLVRPATATAAPGECVQITITPQDANGQRATSSDTITVDIQENPNNGTQDVDFCSIASPTTGGGFVTTRPVTGPSYVNGAGNLQTYNPGPGITPDSTTSQTSTSGNQGNTTAGNPDVAAVTANQNNSNPSGEDTAQFQSVNGSDVVIGVVGLTVGGAQVFAFIDEPVPASFPLVTSESPPNGEPDDGEVQGTSTITFSNPPPSPSPSASATASATPSATGSASPRPSGSASATATPTGTATAPGGTQSPAAPTQRLTLRVTGPSTITPGQGGTMRATGEANAAIELRCYSRPSTEYFTAREGSIGSDGVIDFRINPGTNTRCFIKYLGAADDDVRNSPSVVQNVATAMSLTVTRNSFRDYTFQGRILPRRAGQLITLYRVQDDGREIITSQIKTDSTGTWYIRRVFQGSGTFPFVARTGQNLTNVAGASNTRPTAIH